jgi:hypothetical protein
MQKDFGKWMLSSQGVGYAIFSLAMQTAKKKRLWFARINKVNPQPDKLLISKTTCRFI